MTITIAVAGKGGTGKTTVAGLIVRYLMRQRQGTILAIDADPSSNLHFVLGMDLEETIGDIREDMLDQVQANSTLASSMRGAGGFDARRLEQTGLPGLSDSDGIG